MAGLQTIISLKLTYMQQEITAFYFACLCSKALFIYPVKKFFFVRLQIFLHAGCNFLPPEELTPHAKIMSVVIDVYKFGPEILHNWHFLEIFVQLTKNNSSQICIPYSREH